MSEWNDAMKWVAVGPSQRHGLLLFALILLLGALTGYVLSGLVSHSDGVLVVLGLSFGAGISCLWTA